MDRDLAAEIDALRAELQQLRKMAMQGFALKASAHATGEGTEVLSAEARKQLEEIRAYLVGYTELKQVSGAVAYAGTFVSDEGESTRQSIWAMSAATDDLLRLNENQMVEKVLVSVGNGQRLAILLALLQKPSTVSQLVEALGAASTGQIYHHLKPLVTADLIYEEKGVYAIRLYRVQGVIMLLTGVRDLIDTKYTSGSWEQGEGA